MTFGKKSIREQILRSTLYESGAVFTVKDMHFELGGRLNNISVAVNAMAQDGDLRKAGPYRYAKFESHWINTGRLAGENLVRCPQ